MKTFSNKTIASLIAITLVISIAASIAFLPSASAARREYDDMVYLSIAPNTAGIGQSVILSFWCDKLPPTALGDYGDRWTFDVNIIKPDGSNDTITGITSDPVGAAYTTYSPTTEGLYVVQVYMEKHTIDGGASRNALPPFFATRGAGWWPSGQPPSGANAGFNPIGVVFNDAWSQYSTLNVTSNPVPKYVETPLPTNYWTRPVYDANRGWSTYTMGQWLGASELAQYGDNGRYNPYSVGPASSHVLWTKPFFNGGIAGGVSTVNGSSSDNSYYSGQSYENYGGPSIVLNGKVYWTSQTNPREGWYVVDLYTGETLYWANTTGGVMGVGTGQTSTGNVPVGAPAFGQVLTYDSPNQHGTISYYWVTSTPGGTVVSSGPSSSYVSNKWEMYDDFTNQRICAIDNVTWQNKTVDGRTITIGATGTSAVGTDGSILRYNVVNYGTTTAPQWYLQVWNTSQAIMYPFYVIHNSGSGTNTNWLWRPNFNQTYDGTAGFSANVSIPSIKLQSSATIRQVIPDDQMVVIYAGVNNGTAATALPGTVYNINLKPGHVGEILYSYNFTAPATTGDSYGQNEQFSTKDTTFGGVNIQAGVFWYTDSMTRQFYIYDLATGNQLWTMPQAPQMEFYGMGTLIYYKGMLIDTAYYGGVVRAFDARTGTFLWNWSAPSVGEGETAYEYTPTQYGCLSGDGLLYLYSTEHSVNNPIRRDAQIWCVNVTDGKMLWMLTDWPSVAPIIADGRLIVVDCHDMELYCFGKGTSATTVSAPQVVPTLGSGVMISGTVTDQTQGGRRTSTGSVDFSLKGTPAISDASMDSWMEYMFHQRPKPTDATGVTVTLNAIDPNGNWVPVGTTTSDMYGNYGLTFTPQVPGTYQIIAEFAGSNSYGPSSSSTYLAVGDSAATPTPAATQAPQSMADLYFVPAIVGLLVAIVLVGAVVVLMLRKRP